MEKPTLEEAESDLRDIREELRAMRGIVDYADFLSGRKDVNAPRYRQISWEVGSDIAKGANVEQAILKRYPELQ